MRLLTAPRFSWVHRQPSTHIWSLLECAAPAAPLSVGPAVFLGSPPTHHPKYLFQHITKDLRAQVLSQNGNTTIVIAETDTRQTAHSITPTNHAHQQRTALPMQVNHSVVFPPTPLSSQNHFHPKTTVIPKPLSSQNHFHPKPVSSKTTFIPKTILMREQQQTRATCLCESVAGRRPAMLHMKVG